MSEPGGAGTNFWETGIGNLPPGRLVSLIDSAEDWTSWEVHPNGEEFILHPNGELELLLEEGGQRRHVHLRPNEFANVAREVWHTANVPSPGSALYITSGNETKYRKRT